MTLNHLPRPVRRGLVGTLACGMLALAACSDSTGPGDNVFRTSGTLDGSGNALVTLPQEIGNAERLPALSCYTADPQAQFLDWFQIASVEGTSNCILQESRSDPNRLDAVIEGETPGWLYQFVLVY
jgi:hypothetical protein